MKMTLKQGPLGSVVLTLTAENEAEQKILKSLFGQNLTITPTPAQANVLVDPATDKPSLKLPPPLDDSVCSGHKEPTCKQCGCMLVNKKDCWACPICGGTISMAQGIMARATEDDKQAD